MIAVIGIIIYKWSWKFFPFMDIFQFSNRFADSYLGLENIIMIPISVIVMFMIIGVIEEYSKNLVVRIVDRGSFKSVDDAIIYSIIAALGFSFVENILYFFYIWQNQSIESLFIPFVFRSIFSTFAHVFFSGIYGYYYGVAYFSKPFWREEIQANRGKFVSFLHKILGLKSQEIFEQTKRAQGLLIAVSLHAVFNVFLEMNWTFLIVPFLFTGFFVLTSLLDRKEYHKILERID
ncbi:PrsW family intramembrane metalloprotease [Patescibacteria group bacterium]|nr:PrsW family intramembrane metalloprotease [Patescibacteria group bacterium]